jgi:hypothetical protein
MRENQNIQRGNSARLVWVVILLVVLILGSIIVFPFFAGIWPDWGANDSSADPLEATELTEVVLLEGCNIAIEYDNSLQASYLPKDEGLPVEIGLRLARGDDRLVINCLARLEDDDFDDTIPYPTGVSNRETVPVEAAPFLTEASREEILNVQRLFLDGLEADLKTRWLIETIDNKLIYVDVYSNGARLYDQVAIQFDYLASVNPSVYIQDLPIATP